MKQFGSSLLFILGVVGHAMSQAVDITFDGTPLQPRNTQFGIPQYTESGLLFKPFGPIDPAPPYRLIRNGGGISFYPENGTAYLQTGFGGSLEFLTLNGSPFSLLTVDLAEYSTVLASPRTVTFNGFRSDGTMVSATFTTDGVIDGTGQLRDFQTFTFGSEFTGLVRVEVPTQGYSLDNLVVVAVPEPSAVCLWLVALVTMWRYARRKRAA